MGINFKFNYKMLTKKQWNLRLGMYKSGMIDFEDIYSTINEHCSEAKKVQSQCYTALQDEINNTCELYERKMKEQSAVGDYDAALKYQYKAGALEDVLIIMKRLNIV